MISLGDVHIRREELTRITGRGRKLRLVLEWPQVDLPVLIDLDGRLDLRFDHLVGDFARLPVHDVRWSAGRVRDDGQVAIVVDLALGAQ